jgi:glucuronate isomerase
MPHRQPVRPRCRPAAAIYEAIADLPITSPHGHCDPSMVRGRPRPFPTRRAPDHPDHYVFRMLYSQGVRL